MTTRASLRVASRIAVTVALAGCSAAGGSAFGGHSDAGRDARAGGSPGGDFSLNDGGESPVDDGCADEARLVYVVSVEKTLYSFAPATLAFTRVGVLGCAAAAATPNSMAVDRAGTAWVNYNDGRLFKVSVKDASCVPTTLTLGTAAGVGPRVGMGFSTNAGGGREETLYVADLTGKGLATIDTTTLKVTRLGAFAGALAGASAELTGTGDARLYGFFDTSPASLAEITKATAQTPAPKTIPGLRTGQFYAFSFYGGDFWFYTADGSASTSQVTRYRPADGTSQVVIPNAGFRIVGAGVSTCAPVRPPA